MILCRLDCSHHIRIEPIMILRQAHTRVTENQDISTRARFLFFLLMLSRLSTEYQHHSTWRSSTCSHTPRLQLSCRTISFIPVDTTVCWRYWIDWCRNEQQAVVIDTRQLHRSMYSHQSLERWLEVVQQKVGSASRRVCGKWVQSRYEYLLFE